MVKGTKKTTANDSINTKRTSKITDYASQKTSNPKIHTTDSNNSDDLIVSLADAYENKQARQVIEWETLRRKTLYKTA